MAKNWWDPQPKVQLGCGTLILITLIVMIFSGKGRNSSPDNTLLRRNVTDLETSVDELDRHVKKLDETLIRMERKLDKLAEPAATTSTLQ